MTDHPRFRIATLNSDICYRHYHGAAAVEWSFRAADWWLSRRERMSQDKPGTQMRSRVALRVACLAGLLALCSAASADDPARTDGDKYKVRFENDRVRVLEYRDRPGEKTHQHRHPAFVLYAIGQFKRRITLPDGKGIMREFKAGDVLWSDAQTHIGENVGDTPTHVIMVEMK